MEILKEGREREIQPHILTYIYMHTAYSKIDEWRYLKEGSFRDTHTHAFMHTYVHIYI